MGSFPNAPGKQNPWASLAPPHQVLPIQSPLPWDSKASATLRDMFWFFGDPLRCDGFAQFLSSLPVTSLAKIVPHLWVWRPPHPSTTPRNPSLTVGRMHLLGCLSQWGQA